MLYSGAVQNFFIRSNSLLVSYSEFSMKIIISTSNTDTVFIIPF